MAMPRSVCTLRGAGSRAAGGLPADLEYFCFDCPGAVRPLLPFAWEEIAAVPMDRVRMDPPERVVVVGRRVH